MKDELEALRQEAARLRLEAGASLAAAERARGDGRREPRERSGDAVAAGVSLSAAESGESGLTGVSAAGRGEEARELPAARNVRPHDEMQGGGGQQEEVGRLRAALQAAEEERADAAMSLQQVQEEAQQLRDRLRVAEERLEEEADAVRAVGWASSGAGRSRRSRKRGKDAGAAAGAGAGAGAVGEEVEALEEVKALREEAARLRGEAGAARARAEACEEELREAQAEVASLREQQHRATLEMNGMRRELLHAQRIVADQDSTRLEFSRADEPAPFAAAGVGALCSPPRRGGGGFFLTGLGESSLERSLERSRSVVLPLPLDVCVCVCVCVRVCVCVCVCVCINM